MCKNYSLSVRDQLFFFIYRMYITCRKWWRPWDTGNVNIWVKIVGWAVSEPIDSFIFPSGVISQMFIELIWPTCFSSFGITVDKSVRCSCRIISWHIVILNWGNPLCHYFSLVLSYDILISLTRAYLVISTVKYLRLLILSFCYPRGVHGNKQWLGKSRF